MTGPILDFGSQVTQLIARRLRETGVYCEIWPFTASDERIRAFAPKGFILSGGPASVTEGASPRAPAHVFESGLPVLGICYGQQTLATQLGGTVEGGHPANSAAPMSMSPANAPSPRASGPRARASRSG